MMYLPLPLLLQIKPFHADSVDTVHVGMKGLADMFSKVNGAAADGQQPGLAAVHQPTDGQPPDLPAPPPQQQHLQEQLSQQVDLPQQQQPPPAAQQQAKQQQQQLQQGVLQHNTSHITSAQQPGLASPAGSGPGQPPGPELTAAAGHAAGPAAAPARVSISEIQVT